MSQNSKIEWCNDTVNFWWGCEKVALGCKNCYAQPIAARFFGDLWGATKPRGYIASAVETCRKLNRKARREGTPRLVFVNSMSDFFEEHDGHVIDREGNTQWRCERCRRIQPIRHSGTSVGICDACYTHSGQLAVSLDDLRRQAFNVMDECESLRFLLLTKRPENVLKMWPIRRDVPYVAEAGAMNEYGLHRRENVWLGVSVEDQATADARIPELLKCRDLAPVLWVSYEPALGPVDFDDYLHDSNCNEIRHESAVCICSEPRESHIDWLVVGGESGTEARPAEIGWFRQAIGQCQDAKTPVFMKQTGKSYFETSKGGQKTHLFPGDPKGGLMEEWPEDLRMREYPAMREVTRA